jgi:hypothetical protein
MPKFTKEEIEEAKKNLREIVKPGSRVYCILRRVSSSGMSRTIDLVVVEAEHTTIYPTDPATGRADYTAKGKRKLTGHRVRSIGWLAAKAMERTYDRDINGIKIGGCGMDMGFSLVYDLGYTLYPKGVRKGYSGTPQKDGGYALKHEWL